MTQSEVESKEKEKSKETLDFEARLLEEDLEDTDSEELFVDSTLLQIREARALIRMWHDMSSQLVEIKTGYKMAKKWDDQELKDRYIEAGKPIIKKVDILENSLKDSLKPLKGVPFLEEQELRLLPKWVHTELGVSVSKAQTSSNSTG